MSLKIKNHHLMGLGTWLNEQQLQGRASRARTRFVGDIQAKLSELEKERISLCEQFAEKDETGAVKKETVDDAERYIFSDIGQKEFADEYRDLLTEDWIVDITDANRDMVSVITSIVLDTEYRFGPREGETPQQSEFRVRQMNDYPHWCEAFEHMSE